MARVSASRRSHHSTSGPTPPRWPILFSIQGRHENAHIMDMFIGTSKKAKDPELPLLPAHPHPHGNLLPSSLSHRNQRASEHQTNTDTHLSLPSLVILHAANRPLSLNTNSTGLESNHSPPWLSLHTGTVLTWCTTPPKRVVTIPSLLWGGGSVSGRGRVNDDEEGKRLLVLVLGVELAPGREGASAQESKLCVIRLCMLGAGCCGVGGEWGEVPLILERWDGYERDEYSVLVLVLVTALDCTGTALVR
ncbi:hypothetical protein DACRYDRAFT_108608 [Dacryopinax primogenitus]|uniref:Uncharacterized protein n=1 Tax=Dacryopinax primogenitus (strain DJM 731) TaxID=1858805 RepID=M5FXM3_DACPD|nr:uncharacterized protein DACRYDRAFT_108608 [Dacryopinax primogenitus]EJU00540.1 hypothetical protein DACRYDRAFT_108608 [Dacryopinax primogenitus]